MIEFDILNDVDGQSLSALAQMLESGLLTPPFTALSLRGIVAQNQTAATADLLNQLAQRTESGQDVGLLLRSFIAGKGYAQTPAEMIDVVVSGPDVSSTARDTGVVMRQMFGSARNRVLVVGFAVHQGREIFRTLAERLDACGGIEATLCVDVRRDLTNTSPQDQIVARFARNLVENEWPGQRLPRVYYDPRSLVLGSTERSALHSKCVVVDGSDALVTSANFTEAAQERNIELGLRVGAPEIARQVEDHFLGLIQRGHLVRLPVQ
ncbi:MAG: DISARM system phospholipase D-like protein DrmC [Chloroflexi bacterium]|nr:DISARM system phospholipase D-like protein DrmC [Chloroflexota bacterium]